MAYTDKPIEILIAELDDPNLDVRIMAAEALGHRGDQEAVPALIRALNNDCGEMIAVIAKSLGKLEDIRALEPLLELLETVTETQYIPRGTHLADELFRSENIQSVRVDGGIPFENDAYYLEQVIQEVIYQLTKNAYAVEPNKQSVSTRSQKHIVTWKDIPADDKIKLMLWRFGTSDENLLEQVCATCGKTAQIDCKIFNQTPEIPKEGYHKTNQKIGHVHGKTLGALSAAGIAFSGAYLWLHPASAPFSQGIWLPMIAAMITFISFELILHVVLFALTKIPVYTFSCDHCGEEMYIASNGKSYAIPELNE